MSFYVHSDLCNFEKGGGGDFWALSWMKSITKQTVFIDLKRKYIDRVPYSSYFATKSFLEWEPCQFPYGYLKWDIGVLVCEVSIFDHTLRKISTTKHKAIKRKRHGCHFNKIIISILNHYLPFPAMISLLGILILQIWQLLSSFLNCHFQNMFCPRFQCLFYDSVCTWINPDNLLILICVT